MTADQAIPGVLVLYPLIFAGATPGVIADTPPPAGVPLVGLPQASFKVVVKRDGNREGAVQAVVDPPQGGSYLNIALYMKAPRDAQPQLIERKPVAPADQNEPVYFNVYQSVFNDGVHHFFYVVERTSGNSEPSTESWALYHRDLPGGNDVPGTGDHPSLNISLPPELGDPPQIGKEEVDQGVRLTLSYTFMKPYDEIILELNRERFNFTVQPGKEGQPYFITVTRAMFESAGNHPEFAISFTVVSQVNNPTDKRRWSRTIKANVDTERVTLTPPDLSENPDDPADDPTTIELGKLKDFLYALVHVFSPLWGAGDTVRVSYTCTPPKPGTVVTHSVEATVGRLPFTHKLQVPAAKVLANSEVSVIYEQVRDGKVMGTSKPAEARVIGESVTEPPTITSVKGLPSDVEIPENTSTSETSFVFSGTASANQTIELRDAGVKKDTIAVGLTGDWTHTLNGQAVGVHKYTVKATYGGLPESKPWVLTVEQRIYFEDFETWPLVTIKAPGQLITGRTMVVHYVSGKGEVRIAKAPYSNGSERSLYLYNEGGQYIRLQFKWSCSKVSFFIADVAHPGQYVNAYDSNRNLLDRKELPAGNRPVTLTLSSSGPKIESLEFLLIDSFDPIPLDDFLFVD